MRIVIGNTLYSVLAAVPSGATCHKCVRVRRGLWRLEYSF